MQNNFTNERVAIIGYNRSPFARINTDYLSLGNQDMLTHVLNGLIERYNLHGARLGEVAGGAVIKHTRESSLVRESILGTALSPLTPAVDLQQACATGVEAAIYIANKIALGQIDSGIACGVDSTSNVPIVVGEKLRTILLEAHRSKNVWSKVKIFAKLRPRDFLPAVPGIKESRTSMSMGDHTELTAKFYGISREEQDFYAMQSHRKLAKAYQDGFFSDMLSPLMGLESDNNLRRDTTMEKLSKLKTSFDPINGSLTAGNSTPFTDGASSLLLSSERWARERRLPVKAYISFAEVAAIEYVDHPQNLLLAPVYAANRMMGRSGYDFQSFDYYEIHEAFAAQVLATLKIWEDKALSNSFGFEPLGKIDMNRLNVYGGSLAAAHPFAATGGRIIATLAKLLYQKGTGRGFLSVCAAGGQGATMILER